MTISPGLSFLLIAIYIYIYIYSKMTSKYNLKPNNRDFKGEKCVKLYRQYKTTWIFSPLTLMKILAPKHTDIELLH